MIITLNELRELEASTKRQRITDAIYAILSKILEPDAEIRTKEDSENCFLFEIIDSFSKKNLFVFYETNNTVSICDNMEEPTFIYSTNFCLEDFFDLFHLKIFLTSKIKKQTFKVFNYNILA